MNKYESVIIVNPNVEENTLKELIERFQTLINTDGKVEQVNELGKKKLAYEINNDNTFVFVHSFTPPYGYITYELVISKD